MYGMSIMILMLVRYHHLTLIVALSMPYFIKEIINNLIYSLFICDYFYQPLHVVARHSY
jgi:hypothetical protein